MSLPDLTKLNEIIDSKITNPTDAILFRDTFALACYLHLEGNKGAGIKLCETLFEKIGWNSNKTYFSEIIKAIPGNEKKFALKILAHGEICKLFDWLPKWRSDINYFHLLE